MRRLGSSPLARGKQHSGPADPPQLGLIPARAGKTSSRRSAATSSAAHPRSRGENAAMAAAVGIGGGSSPLARGKRHSCARKAKTPRLIPARAGKT